MAAGAPKINDGLIESVLLAKQELHLDGQGIEMLLESGGELGGEALQTGSIFLCGDDEFLTW